MSKWEQNAVFEYSEYICLVKRINGIVAQKTLVTELVRCKECKWRGIPTACPIDNFYAQRWTKDDDFCSYGVRKTNTVAEEKPTPIRDYMVHGERKESE